MLLLGEDGFATGVSTYLEEDPFVEDTQTSIHIIIILQSHKIIETTGRLDPATSWVILQPQIYEEIGLHKTSDTTVLRTISGIMEGSIELFPITLVAEQGDSLTIEASLFICDEWQRGNFLGYTGFIQRFRFAIDLFSRKFYFGGQTHET